MTTGIDYLTGKTNTPRWTQFLTEIFEDNEQLIGFVQRLCGMAGRDKRISAIHIKFSDGVTLEEGTERVRDLWTDYRENRSGSSLAYLMDTVTVSVTPL